MPRPRGGGAGTLPPAETYVPTPRYPRPGHEGIAELAYDAAAAALLRRFRVCVHVHVCVHVCVCAPPPGGDRYAAAAVIDPHELRRHVREGAPVDDVPEVVVNEVRPAAVPVVAVEDGWPREPGHLAVPGPALHEVVPPGLHLAHEIRRQDLPKHQHAVPPEGCDLVVIEPVERRTVGRRRMVRPVVRGSGGQRREEEEVPRHGQRQDGGEGGGSCGRQAVAPPQPVRRLPSAPSRLLGPRSTSPHVRARVH